MSTPRRLMSVTRQIAKDELEQSLLGETPEIKQQTNLLITLKKRKRHHEIAQFLHKHKIKIGCFLFFLSSGGLTVSYLSKLRELNDQVNVSENAYENRLASYLNGTCPGVHHSFWYHPEQNIEVWDEDSKRNKVVKYFESLFDYFGNSYEFGIKTVASLPLFFPEICLGLFNQLYEAWKKYDDDQTQVAGLTLKYLLLALTIALVAVPSSIYVCRKLGRVSFDEMATLEEIISGYSGMADSKQVDNAMLASDAPDDLAEDRGLALPAPGGNTPALRDFNPDEKKSGQFDSGDLDEKVSLLNNKLVRNECQRELSIHLRLDDPNTLLGLCGLIFEYADTALQAPIQSSTASKSSFSPG